jgi:hypothetical protein
MNIKPIPPPPVSTDWWYTMVPVISTGHLTKSDSEKLNSPDLYCDPDSNNWVMNVTEGWIINMRAYPGGLLSAEAEALFEALKNEHKFVRLDRDADTIEGLPVFNW